MIRSYLKKPRVRAHAQGVSYTPNHVAEIYNFPHGFDGTGQKIAFIELGGDFSQTDLDTYFHGLGLTVKPAVQHLVDGASPATSDATDEVMLDLCVGGAAAPGAELHVYFGPNSDQGFADAIAQAVKDGMTVISISWGAAEDAWTASGRVLMESALKLASDAGIPVFVAAGDNGSSDGEKGKHVDYPASSARAIGCGGTSLTSASPRTEIVWNDGTVGGATGGGVSTVTAIPTWQQKSNVPGGKFRGVPDLAGNADPETGYQVRSRGQNVVIGGTSAVAPLMAALTARLQQATGKKLGNFTELLYAMAGVSFDVTSGNNGTYVARSGYDCCTGEGVLDGAKVLAALGTPTIPAPPPAPPGPTPAPTTTHTITVTGQNVAINVT